MRPASTAEAQATVDPRAALFPGVETIDPCHQILYKGIRSPILSGWLEGSESFVAGLLSRGWPSTREAGLLFIMGGFEGLLVLPCGC